MVRRDEPTTVLVSRSDVLDRLSLLRNAKARDGSEYHDGYVDALDDLCDFFVGWCHSDLRIVGREADERAW